MRSLKQIHRLLHINMVLAKYGLDEIVTATGWLAPVRFVKYLNPYNWCRDRNKSHGQRIREALEELGPIFVKFGQTLSTRPDLIPEAITNDLAKLQDKVTPFPNAELLISKHYGRDVREMFTHFDAEPLAAASIAQVHAAQLPDGTDVVVKVLRPNVEKKIKRDIDLLYMIARLAERYWADSRRLKLVEIIQEFERTLYYELDLMREAANASQLRRNFSDSPLLYVPEVYWPYCRENVIVLERIHGIPIADIETLKNYGFDLKVLAERGVEIFFTQVFRDCFFHADMHPGNIFVDPMSVNNPRYLAVDFGIIGTLNATDQRYLAENILAFFKRNYRRVAELHVDSGWVPPETRVEEFESAIRTVCEPIFERPLKDISCGQLLLRLIQTGKQFKMEIQPQLILLQKTLLHIEGLGRQLYPDLDLWSTAKPFLERWLKQRMGVKALGKGVLKKLPYWLEKAPEIPELFFHTLDHFKQQEARHFVSADEVYAKKQRIRKTRKSSFAFGFGMALLFAGGVGLVIAEKIWTHPTDAVSISTFVALFGFFVLLIRFLMPEE